ncbi:MAG: hypothetical protein V2A76_08385 [Planctomycetota bacterium]
MARRPNYGFEKRQKDLEKQKKRAEKAEKKRLRKVDPVEGDQAEGASEGEQDGRPAPEGEENQGI